MGRPREIPATPDGRGLRVGVVVARFNEKVTERLLAGALATLRNCGVADDAVVVVRTPGAFEAPLAAQAFAQKGTVDAVVCLGAVIRGETAHFDFVARAVTDGVRSVMLGYGIPVAFGILTTDTEAQAMERSGEGRGNKGDEAVRTALEMVQLLRGIRGG